MSIDYSSKTVAINKNDEDFKKNFKNDNFIAFEFQLIDKKLIRIEKYKNKFVIFTVNSFSENRYHNIYTGINNYSDEYLLKILEI